MVLLQCIKDTKNNKNDSRETLAKLKANLKENVKAEAVRGPSVRLIICSSRRIKILWQRINALLYN